MQLPENDARKGTLGAEVGQLRARSGLTQEELAARCDLSSTCLTEIEAGGYDPSDEALRSLARELSSVGATYERFLDLSRGASDPFAFGRELDQQYIARVKRRLLFEGVGLMALGSAHFWIQSLAKDWGYVLIVLGIASVVIRHRIMFIFNGVALVVAGVWNALLAFGAASPFLLGVPVYQILWGAQEFSQFFSGEVEPTRVPWSHTPP